MLRSIKIRQYLAAMRARGFSTSEVLAGSDIDPELLDDPTYWIDIEQCHIVVSNIIRLTGNKSIGFEIGRTSHITDTGIIGYAQASARTMRQAIVIWLQYGNSPAGWPLKLELFEEKSSKAWGVSAAASGTPLPLLAFYWEEILALGFGFSPLLTGESFTLREVHFSYPDPGNKKRYEELFQCPMIFDAPRCDAIVVSPELDVPLRGDDHSLNELCLTHCAQIMKGVSRNAPITARLRSMLLRNRGVFPSFEEAASGLGMSSRTLRRKLTLEGTGYQKILDNFRSDLAREYLNNGLRAKEVGFLLGFNNPTAFRQAFKKWTGETIRNFRVSDKH